MLVGGHRRAHRDIIADPRADEVDQGRADLLEGQHEMHTPRVDGGLRHPRELGRVRILCDDGATGLLQCAHAHVRVAARAREDHADGAPGERQRSGLEQQVGGRAHEVHRVRVREAEAALGGHEQMLVGRCDVDGGGFDPGPLGRLLDVQRRPPVEDLRHEAAVAGVEVLDDDDGDREVGREAPQDRTDRRQTAGRGGQEDDVERTGPHGPIGTLVLRVRVGHRDPFSHHWGIGLLGTRRFDRSYALATPLWSHIVPDEGQRGVQMWTKDVMR